MQDGIEGYDLELQLQFLKETRNGQYAEIEPIGASTERISENISYIDTEEGEYYYSFDC